jgi:hypothetical protein
MAAVAPRMSELNALHFRSLVTKISPSSFEAAQQLSDIQELVWLAQTVNLISQEEHRKLLDQIRQRLSLHKSFPGYPSGSVTLSSVSAVPQNLQSSSDK